jgi:predicted PurR-regulated permease PerM
MHGKVCARVPQRMTDDLKMEFPERRTINVLLTILLFAAVCGIAYSARRVILLFVLSVFFAYLMNPAVKFLEHHSLLVRNLRGAAVIEVYIGILILIGLATYSFAPAVVRKTMKAVDQVPAILDRVSTGEIAADIGDKYGWSDEQKARLRTVLVRHREDSQGVLRWIDRSLSQAAQIVGWLALIPVLAIFLLRDGNRIVEAAIQMFCPQKHRQRTTMIAHQIHAMLANYIRAQVLLCLFSLAFYAIVLLIFRFPHAIALSILGGMLEFVPVIGWMSTAGVIIGIGMANDLHWLWMTVLLLLWRVAQDYFNLPRALGHRLEIHPLAVIFAVLAGAEVGGIVGIYLAVPLAASLFLIWRLRGSPAESPLAQNAASELPPSLVEVSRD